MKRCGDWLRLLPAKREASACFEGSHIHLGPGIFCSHLEAFLIRLHFSHEAGQMESDCVVTAPNHACSDVWTDTASASRFLDILQPAWSPLVVIDAYSLKGQKEALLVSL